MTNRNIGVRLWCAIRARLARLAADDERGDVPGWVLVTMMTAGIVIALWAVAQPALVRMWEDAMAAVKGP